MIEGLTPQQQVELHLLTLKYSPEKAKEVAKSVMDLGESEDIEEEPNFKDSLCSADEYFMSGFISIKTESGMCVNIESSTIIAFHTNSEGVLEIKTPQISITAKGTEKEFKDFIAYRCEYHGRF